MIRIKLGDRRPVTWEDDDLGREWYGYDPTVSDEELWAHNRGRWPLGPRADQEQYVALVYKGEVKLVAEIAGIDPTRNNKRAFRGPVLGLDHPVANRLVGSKVADGFRNPVRYIGEPDITVTCAYGCGEPVSGGQTFVSGHDQRAIRDRIKRRWEVLPRS
ncbi:MAG: hypothetical protein ACTHMY_22480 [Solirubrobacteraceae bacterium]